MSFSIYNKSLNEAVIFILTNLASKNTHKEVKSELTHAYFQLLFKDDTNALHWNVQFCTGISSIFFSFKYLSPTFLSYVTTQFFIKNQDSPIRKSWDIKIIPLHASVLFLIFRGGIGIHSIQGWTATTRHGVTRKRSTKRLQHTGNLFIKNLLLKGVC